MVDRHKRSDDVKGSIQVITTLVPIAGFWYAVAASAGRSFWLTAGLTVLISFYLLRAFVLMHDCGHGSLFRTGYLNRASGFVFGVLSGLPQPVWAQHHHYHHLTNGNWDRYQGPLNVISVDKYAAMTKFQQRRYRYLRNIWLSPLGGVLYLIVPPRVNWLRASISLVRHVIKKKMACPDTSLRSLVSDFKTPYCASVQAYGHMLANNVTLLTLWVLMAWWIGPILFFACYLVSMSLAGGGAIVLFTVQHNFEHSYASRNEGWDRNTAAIEGTSFLVLPRWLNWFTANMAYHHVHHLCAGIPNYGLVACHNEYQHVFSGVTRIRLSQVPHSVRYILWDTRLRRLVSVAEYLQQAGSGNLP
ncbi:MAG TPA: fatty acid desaturase [Burkholderiaceae bacterium]